MPSKLLHQLLIAWLLIINAQMLFACAAPSSVTTSAGARTSPSCSASLPERLASDFPPDQLLLFAAILPRATSSQPIVSVELRAPLHIACQMKAFPHVQTFYKQDLGRSLVGFTVKSFAQPPHLVFFDARHEVVQAVPIAPSWTPFELRERIVSAMS